MTDIANDLTAICGRSRVERDEPMRKHTTFRIGGPARYFVTPGDERELGELVRYCYDNDLDYFILGNGSNLLVSDEGYDGIVIRMFENISDIRVEGNRLKASAGALLSRIANVAAREGLSGMEASAGIPGTLGGAVVMNAGAYGFEMKDVTQSVRVMKKDGSIQEIPGERMEFGYRTSRCIRDELIVLEAELVLTPGNEEDIREYMKELKERRISRQPLEYPSAGSTFKRPEGYYAGKLIMDSGLRGCSEGDAQVSEKHCGFVINRGSASAKDVMTLITHIQDTVFEKTGVMLEPEIKRLGF